jgi:hypothetical protein
MSSECRNPDGRHHEVAGMHSTAHTGLAPHPVVGRGLGWRLEVGTEWSSYREEHTGSEQAWLSEEHTDSEHAWLSGEHMTAWE